MQKYSYIFVLCSSLILCGCDDPTDIPAVKESELEVKINRFEQDYFSLKSAYDTNKVNSLTKKYPEFFELFNQQIIRIGSSKRPSFKIDVNGFLNDKNINEVYADIQKKFPNMEEQEEQFTEAFRRYQYYFPKRTIPQVLTFFGGFNYATVAAEKSLGIGLEFYLGSDYKPYTLLQKPKYMIDRFKPEYILPDALKGWVGTEFVMDESKAEFIYKMIHYGKLMYLMDLLVPEMEDSLKMGYSSKQMEWVNLSEFSIWSFMVDKKIIYSTEYEHVSKFFNDGPFTSGLPQESPPRIGIWLGWQIVRKYMKAYPAITPIQLMEDKEAQKILNKSKYRPLK